MRTDNLLRHAKIEIVPVRTLRGYDWNARTHGDAQIDQIVASIRSFGFLNPVLADEHNVIIAGHGRVMAAQKLGMDEVPVIRVAGLSDMERRALTLADNRIALNSGWDDTMLASELQAIKEAMDTGEFDLNLDLGDLGFGDAEVEDLMGLLPPPAEPEPERDITIGPEPAVCRIGETWVLGFHRLTVGGPDVAIDANDLILSWQRASRMDAKLATTGETFKSRPSLSGSSSSGPRPGPKRPGTRASGAMVEALLFMLIGHALADYPLQGDRLSKTKNRRLAVVPGEEIWLWALLSHAAIHAGAVRLATGS